MAVRLRVHHAVHLIIDSVEQSVGVDRARNAEFRVRVSTDTGLEQNEIVGIARGKRKVRHFQR